MTATYKTEYPYQKPRARIHRFSIPDISGSVLALMVLILNGCASHKDFMPAGNTKLVHAFEPIAQQADHPMGLAIYDPVRRDWVLRYQDEFGFTPASNTKILTLYAALRVLDDHLVAARYMYSDDSLIIWGGGDPGTLYPDIRGHHPLIDFLFHREANVFFSSHHFVTPRYGPGWAWDDYMGAYQCERNAFPIYGNRLWIERKHDTITTLPHYLSSTMRIAADTGNYVERSEWGDRFTYRYSRDTPNDIHQVPIAYFPNDIRLCWEEATHIPITTADLPMRKGWLPLRGSSRDSLLRIMMQESDNFIADQLLLSASLTMLDSMSESAIIDSLLRGPMAFLRHDSIEWVDGSGLSRYNFITPRSLVMVLDRIYKEKGMEYISGIFPAGGVSGTIRHLYQGKNNKPYLFAKTGTLRHVHCLSGYLVTRKGEVLIFSWMHNQLPGDTRMVKNTMNTFFSFLYDHY